jgi:hypothetical protein
MAEKITALTSVPEGMTREDAFMQSPFAVAYDVLGQSFLDMPAASRSFMMDLVRSGDLTADDIIAASQYVLPYDPTVGVSDSDLSGGRGRATNVDASRAIDTYDSLFDFHNNLQTPLSDEEFYKKYFGYDVQKTPEYFDDILLGYSDNLPPEVLNYLDSQRFRSSLGIPNFKQISLLTEEPEQPAMGLLGT